MQQVDGVAASVICRRDNSMKCLNCGSRNGEFILFCYWKCWDCGIYSACADNSTMKEYYEQQRKRSNTERLRGLVALQER